MLHLTPAQRDLRKMKRGNGNKKSRKNRAESFTEEHVVDPNANSLSTLSFEDDEVMTISFRIKQFIFGHKQKSMAAFLVQNPSFWENFLYRSDESQFGIDKSFGSWWQTIFDQYLRNSYRLHSKLNQTTLETVFGQNMPIVNFMIAVLSIGNCVIPSPLKEILDDVCERQKYLIGYLPHTPTYQQEQNLQVDQGDEQVNYENCVTLLAMRTMKQNKEMKPEARARCINDVYPSQMWIGDGRKYEYTFRKNVQDVAMWPLYNSTKGSAMKGEKYAEEPEVVNIDYIPFFLLIIVSIYANDSSLNGSKDKDKVDQLQNQHLHLLYKYLKFNYPKEAFARLANGISAISKAREACQILQNFTSLYHC